MAIRFVMAKDGRYGHWERKGERIGPSVCSREEALAIIRHVRDNTDLMLSMEEHLEAEGI